jgi:hypothetical protein
MNVVDQCEVSNPRYGSFLVEVLAGVYCGLDGIIL